MLREKYHLDFGGRDKWLIGLHAIVAHESDTTKTIYYEYMVYNPTMGPMNRKQSWELTKLIETVSDWDLQQMIKKGTLRYVGNAPEFDDDRLDKIID